MKIIVIIIYDKIIEFKADFKVGYISSKILTIEQKKLDEI